MKTNELHIKNGDVVLVEGHPMTVSNLRIEGEDTVRFEGICIEHKNNAGIMNTGFNGGTYGSYVDCFKRCYPKFQA